jgi:hypothetical protein
MQLIFKIIRCRTGFLPCSREASYWGDDRVRALYGDIVSIIAFFAWIPVGWILILVKCTGIIDFDRIVLFAKKWHRWRIKSKNLLLNRSWWEKSAIFRVFLALSAHFQ